MGQALEENKEERKSETVKPAFDDSTPFGKIRLDLLEKAQKYLNGYDGYGVALTSKKVQGLEVRQYKDPELGGTMVSITKGKIDGLTIEKYKEFVAE